MARIWQLLVLAPGETVQVWREPRDPFILGVFFGVMAILAIYHLLLSLSLRDPSYLAYALLLVSFISVLAIAEGLVYRYVLGGRRPLVNNLLSLGFTLLLLLWMAQFSRLIFNTRRELPVVDRVLVGMIVFDVANLLLWVTIFGAVRSTYPVQFLVPAIGTVHTALLLAVGVICTVRKAPFAGLYLLGWVLMAGGSWVQMLREDQLVADNLATRYAMYWGVLGQISCLTLTVSFRLDRMRQHREQQMRKLMEADKLVSIGSMATSLGHEIANPNSAIASNAAFLRQYYEHVVALLDAAGESDGDGFIGDLPHRVVRDRMRRAIAGIVHSADRIAGIISAFRSFYRRTRVEHTEMVDLNRVVDSALVVFGHQIRRHNIPLRMKLAPSLPAVAGNAQQLEQVVVNLLSNAVEAIREARHVGDEGGVEGITITTRASDQGVELMVADDGVGMEPGTVNRIGEVFFSTREERGGTGLGLYVSNHIIGEHSGSLSFASERGAGTTATATLPSASTGNAAARSANAGRPAMPEYRLSSSSVARNDRADAP